MATRKKPAKRAQKKIRVLIRKSDGFVMLYEDAIAIIMGNEALVEDLPITDKRLKECGVI